jgi:hypothetical protein
VYLRPELRVSTNDGTRKQTTNNNKQQQQQQKQNKVSITMQHTTRLTSLLLSHRPNHCR